MKYWLLYSDADSYENLMCEKEIDLDFLHSFTGKSKIGTWESPKFKRMYNNRKFSNFPDLATHIPVCDKKAVTALKDCLKDNAEVLPLLCDDGDFYAINVVNVQNCIDYDKSQYMMFDDGKRIMMFTKYVFDETKIINCGDIFKLSDEVLKRPFVSDKFRQIVVDSGLTGFKFELAWDSDVE